MQGASLFSYLQSRIGKENDKLSPLGHVEDKPVQGDGKEVGVLL